MTAKQHAKKATEYQLAKWYGYLYGSPWQYMDQPSVLRHCAQNERYHAWRIAEIGRRRVRRPAALRQEVAHV